MLELKSREDSAIPNCEVDRMPLQLVRDINGRQHGARYNTQSSGFGELSCMFRRQAGGTDQSGAEIESILQHDVALHEMSFQS